MTIDLRSLRGLRFPDVYVIRMFFKEGLHSRPGRVLELGCGSGNNLLLFRAFGWETVGVDVSKEQVAFARHNLASEGPGAVVIEADLEDGLPELRGTFEAVLLPSVNYYLRRQAFERLMRQCARLIVPGGAFFIRSRTPDDWRFGRGREVEPNGFVLDCTETGEQGLLNVFYAPDELLAILGRHLGPLSGQQVLRARFENPQGGRVIVNDDVVVWGRRG